MRQLESKHPIPGTPLHAVVTVRGRERDTVYAAGTDGRPGVALPLFRVTVTVAPVTTEENTHEQTV